MENIDERDIDAARFCRQIVKTWDEATQRPSQAGLRLAALLLFMELAEHHHTWFYDLQDGSFSDDPQRLRMRLHEKFKIKDVDPYEWDDVPQPLVDHFRDLIAGHDRLVSLRRLDFIVERLGDGLGKENLANRHIERFVAAFVKRWRVLGGDVLDVNAMTTGEIGVALKTRDALRAYYLADEATPLRFEVCLRLLAHGVDFFNVSETKYADDWRWRRVAYGFPPKRRPHMPIPRSFYDDRNFSPGKRF